MPSSTPLITPRASLFGRRGRLFTPGYTPLPPLRRITEDGSSRITEDGHYRISERNTVLAV